MPSSNAFFMFLKTVFTSRLDFGESVTLNTCFVFLSWSKTSSDLSLKLENTANLDWVNLAAGPPNRLACIGKC